MLTSGKVTLSVAARSLASALILTACASRQPSLQLKMELGRAEALVADGCHGCLTEALSIYERAAGTPNAPSEAARGAFRTAVLLVMRARELGLPSEPGLARARQWAGKVKVPVPTQAGAAIEASPSILLDALTLVSGELYGLPPEERERISRERRAAWPTDGSLPSARAALSQWVNVDLVAQYLVIAIDCEDARARKGVSHTDIAARHPQPLIRWRLALCGIPGLRLDPLRAADGRWVDTLFFEGRAEMTKFPAPDVGRGAELFTDAHAAFPESVAITLSLGNALNALEEHEAALELFDAILAEQATHRDAMLGRLLSLSYLKRH
jgi:hypothetical protein